MSAILFIDANAYLYLYGLRDGNKLLDLLDLLREKVFVPTQVVDEVQRRKLDLAKQYFSQNFDEATNKANVPDHILGISNKDISNLKKVFEAANKAAERLKTLQSETLSKISRSEDQVSGRLKSLFESAVSPETVEIDRARDRQERGNPPGKPSNPLGDQITGSNY